MTYRRHKLRSVITDYLDISAFDLVVHFSSDHIQILSVRIFFSSKISAVLLCLMKPIAPESWICFRLLTKTTKTLLAPPSKSRKSGLLQGIGIGGSPSIDEFKGRGLKTLDLTVKVNGKQVVVHDGTVLNYRKDVGLVDGNQVSFAIVLAFCMCLIIHIFP